MKINDMTPFFEYAKLSIVCVRRRARDVGLICLWFPRCLIISAILLLHASSKTGL